MCGIFGIIGKPGNNLRLLKSMSKVQEFRGPDKKYFYNNKKKNIFLGTNRLAVIDIKHGHQPMPSSDKDYLVNFNGTIYNFKEIKKYLIKKKIKFNTNCDTEVIANAYQYWGKKSFNYFDGMWAISIYDIKSHKIILSRDYTGQKPLYYSINKNYLLFSSQISGILEDKSVSKKISTEGISEYFQYSFIPAPNTLLQNIYQLAPGSYLTYDIKKNKIEKKTYWNINKGPNYNLFFPRILENNFVNMFDKVIKEHTISDVEPSVLLSSGIDSYLVAKFLKKNLKKLKTFSLGFKNKTFNETDIVRKIKDPFEKNIFYLDSKKSFEILKKIRKNLDHPIGDSSLIPTYAIFEQVKKKTKVSLGGDGGDENFFGYITFDAFYFANKIKKFFPNFIFQQLKKITKILPVTYSYINLSQKIRIFIENLDQKSENLLPSWSNSLNQLELEDLLKDKNIKNIIYSHSKKIFDKKKPLMKNAQNYYFSYFLPVILQKVDQASMLNSVEHRSPFLSKKILNFSLDGDCAKLYKTFYPKFFLKKIFYGLIPQIILKQKKHGFAFPKNQILDQVDKVRNLIDEKLLTNKTFFYEKYNCYLLKKKDYSNYLWNELILNLTLQNINKKNECRNNKQNR